MVNYLCYPHRIQNNKISVMISLLSHPFTIEFPSHSYKFFKSSCILGLKKWNDDIVVFFGRKNYWIWKFEDNETETIMVLGNVFLIRKWMLQKIGSFTFFIHCTQNKNHVPCRFSINVWCWCQYNTKITKHVLTIY